METSSLAYVFDAPHSSDDDMYSLIEDNHEAAPLSPDDQALLMGMYPATMADLDFVATVQALPLHAQPQQPQQHCVEQHNGLPDKSSQLYGPKLTAGTHSDAAAVFKELQTPFFSSGAASLSPPPALAPQKNERGKQQSRPAQRTRSHTGSPVASPTTSANGSDGDGDGDGGGGFRDSEEILNAPVKSLTEEEKKLRRRAQVAKSARKHRNRQKEELTRLREQVQLLQEQMAKMMHHSGGESAERIKQEQEVITHHRKRKKVDDLDDLLEAEDSALIATQSQLSTLSTNESLDLEMTLTAPIKIQHWFHHLPVDTLQRTKKLHNIAAKRMDLALQYMHSEFGPGPLTYPLTDVKLNSNGPDIEVKLLRTVQVPGFTHQELGEACWNSTFNFQLDIPERFRPFVKCERLMELDENTRYGRTIAPLLKDTEANRIVFFHSYFIMHRRVFDQFVLITWETIHVDELYPPEDDESAEFTLRNDEVGCVIIESEPMANGGVRALYRSITHSTPPVGALTHPKSKINEAFLMVFCRNADIVEASARNLLLKTHPDRVSKPEIVA